MNESTTQLSNLEIQNLSALEKEWLGIETSTEYTPTNPTKILPNGEREFTSHRNAVKNPERPLSNEITGAVPVNISSETYSHMGKYAGALVLSCFEKMGGIDSFVNWAKMNPTDYYTKLLPKIISSSKNIEVNKGGSDDELIALEASFREMT